MMPRFASVAAVLGSAALLVGASARTRFTVDHTSSVATSGVLTLSMRTDISAALAKCAANWNAGNLDAFMSIYLDTDRTTYAMTSEYLHGKAAIAGHYARDFAPGAARDSLRLEKVEVDSLTPTLAQVLAFYVLTRGDSTTSHGPTSLTMQRVRGVWYIVHDHSS